MINLVQCGALFGRNNGQSYESNVAYVRNNGYNTGYTMYNNVRNIPYANERSMDGSKANEMNESLRTKSPAQSGSGLSAWGIITIIMLIIMIGMGGYYGFICYPLICKQERNYDIMDAASTTASANTPTRSGDFEKSGNYSSRSTTPSVIITSLENKCMNQQ